MALGLLGGFALGSLMSVSPISNALDQLSYSVAPNRLSNETIYIDLYRRKLISKETYYELMKLIGFSSDNAKLIYRANDSVLTPEQTLLKLIHDRLGNLDNYYSSLEKIKRENPNLSKVQFENLEKYKELVSLTEEKTKEFLKNYYDRQRINGYTAEEALNFFEGNRPLPSFSQQLEFLAKEAYEPELYEKFGFNAEIPEQVETYFSSYGVPKKEQEKYWISHWANVPPAMWASLYQRFRKNRTVRDNDGNIVSTSVDTDTLNDLGYTLDDVEISQKDYKDYLKVLEFSPYMRSRLEANSYRPLNFTILQQAWQYGTISENKLLGYLEDYGFSPSNSKIILNTWLRKFPVKSKSPLEDNIVKKYILGKISKSTAKTELSKLISDNDVVTYLIDNATDDRNERRVQYKIKTITVQHSRSNFSDQELKEMIEKISGIEKDRVDFLIEEIKLKAEAYYTRVKTRDIRTGITKGTITKDEARKYLASVRMPSEDIEFYLKIYGFTSKDDDVDDVDDDAE